MAAGAELTGGGRVPRPTLILAICCLSVFIVSLDNTIVNVALPSIRRGLTASVSQLQWVIDAYTVVLAGLLILAGSAADRIGRAKVFRLGLAVFVAGSLLCSVAPGASALIAFRALQGIGGSMLNPVAMSIIRNTFDDPRARAQAIGFWGAAAGLSLALGPLLGGALVSATGWRGVFWVNVPIGLVAFFLVRSFVPESRAARARRIDPIGQVLIVVVLTALVFVIIEGHAAGWGSPGIVAGAIVSASALAALIWHERRHPEPVIDPRFFRSVPFAGASLIAVCVFVAVGGFLFMTNLYLQSGRHLPAAKAGLYTLPMAVTAFVASSLSGLLVGRRGARPSLVSGGIGIALSSLMLTGLTAHTEVLWLLLAYFVFGLGLGMVNPPITNTAMAGMPQDQAGVAAAVVSTSRLVGLSLGVAVIGAIAVPAGGLAAVQAGYGEASRPGWWLLTGCGAVVVVLGLASTTATARRTANLAASASDRRQRAARGEPQGLTPSAREGSPVELHERIIGG